MLAKLKASLISASTYTIALLVGILFLWRKESDLEDELRETKANDQIKQDKQAVAQADSTATSAESHFEQLVETYKQEHSNE